MLTGLLGGTRWPYYRDMLGWAIRQDAGGFTLRLGGEVGTVPAEQRRDVVAVPRARNLVVWR